MLDGGSGRRPPPGRRRPMDVLTGNTGSDTIEGQNGQRLSSRRKNQDLDQVSGGTDSAGGDVRSGIGSIRRMFPCQGLGGAAKPAGYSASAKPMTRRYLIRRTATDGQGYGPETWIGIRSTRRPSIRRAAWCLSARKEVGQQPTCRQLTWSSPATPRMDSSITDFRRQRRTRYRLHVQCGRRARLSR